MLCGREIQDDFAARNGGAFLIREEGRQIPGRDGLLRTEDCRLAVRGNIACRHLEGLDGPVTAGQADAVAGRPVAFHADARIVYQDGAGLRTVCGDGRRDGMGFLYGSHRLTDTGGNRQKKGADSKSGVYLSHGHSIIKVNPNHGFHHNHNLLRTHPDPLP